jgi:hypothetical protein
MEIRSRRIFFIVRKNCKYKDPSGSGKFLSECIYIACHLLAIQKLMIAPSYYQVRWGQNLYLVLKYMGEKNCHANDFEKFSRPIC